MGEYEYHAFAIDEDFYEKTLIDYFCENLDYEHLYGPDIPRTTTEYHDVFLPDILPEALERINPTLPRQAINEAVLKINDIDTGSCSKEMKLFTSIFNLVLKCDFSMVKKSKMTLFI